MSTNRTHYDVLGVEQSADAETIRRAWKLNMQAWHPDRFPSDSLRADAAEKTTCINEAWNVLRNTDKRSAYDRTLDTSSSKSSPSPKTPFTTSPFGRSTPPPKASAAASVPAQESISVRDILVEVVRLCRKQPALVGTIAAIWIFVVAVTMLSDLPGRSSHSEARLAAAEAALEESLATTDADASASDTTDDSESADTAFPENDPDVVASGAGETGELPDAQLDPESVPDESRWVIPEPTPAPRGADRPHVIRVTPKR